MNFIYKPLFKLLFLIILVATVVTYLDVWGYFIVLATIIVLLFVFFVHLPTLKKKEDLIDKILCCKCIKLLTECESKKFKDKGVIGDGALNGLVDLVETYVNSSGVIFTLKSDSKNQYFSIDWKYINSLTSIEWRKQLHQNDIMEISTNEEFTFQLPWDKKFNVFVPNTTVLQTFQSLS